jgi:hypothetical protein
MVLIGGARWCVHATMIPQLRMPELAGWLT